MSPSIIWISAALFTWGIGEGMFYMFQPFYLSQLGADPIMIGYILGAAGLAMMIAHIPAGYLADRIGRRPMLIAAWLIAGFATWIMALAPSLPIFVIGLLIYGLTNFVTSPLNSYITAARGNWSVARAITFITAIFNLGIVLGPITGGWIGEHYGLRSVYYIAGTIFIFSFFFLINIPSQKIEIHDSSQSSGSLLTNFRFFGFIGLGFFVMVSLYLPQPFTAKFLQDVRGLSLANIGILGTIGGIGNTILTFSLGMFEARLGFILGQIGVGIFSFLIWKMGSFGWFSLAYFLLGGYRAARSLFIAQIRPLVKESQMGLAFGISETILGTTGILVPIAAGFLYNADKASIYPIAVSSIIFAIFLSIILTPKPPVEELQPTLEIME